MREILFRGKRADNGEWVYGSLITERNMFDGNFMTMHIQDIEEPYDDNLIDDETVGQFTGLTDKNGKKIFEHDIVRIYVDFTTMQYVISYDKENARFVVGDTGFTFWSYISTKIEVIGNVHDNLELLNK